MQAVSWLCVLAAAPAAAWCMHEQLCSRRPALRLSVSRVLSLVMLIQGLQLACMRCQAHATVLVLHAALVPLPTAALLLLAPCPHIWLLLLAHCQAQRDPHLRNASICARAEYANSHPRDPLQLQQAAGAKLSRAGGLQLIEVVGADHTGGGKRV